VQTTVPSSLWSRIKQNIHHTTNICEVVSLHTANLLLLLRFLTSIADPLFISSKINDFTLLHCSHENEVSESDFHADVQMTGWSFHVRYSPFSSVVNPHPSLYLVQQHLQWRKERFSIRVKLLYHTLKSQPLNHYKVVFLEYHPPFNWG